MNGVTFGEKHSLRDWGLLLKSRPVISPPEAKTIYIDVAGADGSLDLTEALTGDVKYKNRKVSFEFIVLDARNRWSNIYSEIMDYLHGQQMKIVLDEDSSYYYVGRLNVDEWNSNKVTSTIKISGIVDPYKYEQNSSLEDWEWDTFNFETGYIRDYRDIEIVGKRNVAIDGTRKTIVPTIIATIPEGETLTVYSSINYQVVTLVNGKNKNPYLKIPMEGVRYTFSGVGKISIDYRGARL